MMKKVAVFGSAKVRPGDSDYEASVQVGRGLASAGFAIITGGFYGVMEATSKGAHEVGGHVIGVTTDQISILNKLQPNAYVKEVVNYAELRDRIIYMVREADAYVAMPGGVGTLHEIAETWELMRIGGIPQRPFVCYGKIWSLIVQTLLDSPYLGDGYSDMIKLVSQPEDVVSLLRQSL